MAIDDFHLPMGARRFVPRWVRDYPRALVFIFKHRHVPVVGLSAHVWVRTLQRLLALHGIGNRYVVTLPERLIYRQAMGKMLALTACRNRQKIEKRPPLAIFRWMDVTIARECPELDHLAKSHRVLNYRCRDLSKSRLDRAAENVMGYSAVVDPTNQTGPMVMKSDAANGRHDGQIIEGPLPADHVDPEMIYMKVIDNQCDEQHVEDLRMPIIDCEIPFVYRKVRPLHNRFSNANARVTIAKPDEVLSDVEVDQVIACARELGLDYAEVDVLRDRTDGRIYFIDANWCSYGLPNHITSADEHVAVQAMTESVCRLFERSH